MTSPISKFDPRKQITSVVDSAPDTNSTLQSANESRQLLFENLKWLTAREAVVYLRLPSVGALRNLVYRRKIPYCKIGRSLRFSREALDRYLESSTVKRRIAA